MIPLIYFFQSPMSEIFVSRERQLSAHHHDAQPAQHYCSSSIALISVHRRNPQVRRTDSHTRQYQGVGRLYTSTDRVWSFNLAAERPSTAGAVLILEGIGGFGIRL